MLHQNVPFFGNTRDNTHCYQASMRMILKYFEPEKTFTWKKLEELSAKKKGKWTWPTQMLLNLQKMGYTIRQIDPFVSDQFIERGGEFLIELWGKEVGEAQIQNSDIAQERRLYKTFNKTISPEKRAPTLIDLKRFLKEGYLVECNVNSAAFSKKKGYAGHSVLVIGYDKNHIILHDPGLPPRPERRVTNAVFKKAWMVPSDGHQTLTGIKLEP